MEKKQGLSEIVSELVKQVQNLAAQMSRLESRITGITGKLGEIDQDLEAMEAFPAGLPNEDPDVVEFSCGKAISDIANLSYQPESSHYCAAADGFSNIIPFPGLDLFKTVSTRKEPDNFHSRSFFASSPFLAAPGKSLCSDIPDHRSFLQRDGLILLAWDKRITEMGERYTAYWVTSIGTPRFYASRPHFVEDFSLAIPDHKSYAAEDGIEFYGQKAPAYMVHVAPELMMSNPRHGELRKIHIMALKQLGSEVDFDYRYLLTMEKKRSLPLRKSAKPVRRKTPTQGPAS